MNYFLLLLFLASSTCAMEPSDSSMEVEGSKGNPLPNGTSDTLQETIPFWFKLIHSELKQLREIEQQRLALEQDQLRLKAAELSLRLEKLQLSYAQKRSKALDPTLISSVKDLVSDISQKDTMSCS